MHFTVSNMGKETYFGIHYVGEQLGNSYLLLYERHVGWAVEDDVLQDGEGCAERPGVNGSLVGYE